MSAALPSRRSSLNIIPCGASAWSRWNWAHISCSSYLSPFWFTGNNIYVAHRLCLGKSVALTPRIVVCIYIYIHTVCLMHMILKIWQMYVMYALDFWSGVSNLVIYGWLWAEGCIFASLERRRGPLRTRCHSFLPSLHTHSTLHSSILVRRKQNEACAAESSEETCLCVCVCVNVCMAWYVCLWVRGPIHTVNQSGISA